MEPAISSHLHLCSGGNEQRNGQGRVDWADGGTESVLLFYATSSILLGRLSTMMCSGSFEGEWKDDKPFVGIMHLGSYFRGGKYSGEVQTIVF